MKVYGTLNPEAYHKSLREDVLDNLNNETVI